MGVGTFSVFAPAKPGVENPRSGLKPRAGPAKVQRPLAVQEDPIAILAQGLLAEIEKQMPEPLEISFLENAAQAAPRIAEELAHAVVLPGLFQKGAGVGIKVEERGRGRLGQTPP